MQYLSKSDYRVARTCGTKLFYRKESYPSSRAGDDYAELLIEGGYMVEVTARVLHPDGIAVDDSPGDEFDRERAAKRTMELLEHDSVTLFGATFIYESLIARADIVRKRGNVIELVEIKAKSFNSDEQAERDAAGKPGLFRSKVKPFGVVSGWRETIEDVAFQRHVITNALPQFDVRSRLMLVDSCKVSPIESLHSQFALTYAERPDGTRSVSGGKFTGDPNALRAGHTLIERNIDDEVELVASDVRMAIEQFVASLAPTRRRIQPELLAHCKDCEFYVEPTGDAEQLDSKLDTRSGYAECWGTLGDAEPHMLELYRVGATKIDGMTLVEHMVTNNKSALFDIPMEKLTKKDGTVGANAQRQIVQITHTKNHTAWFDGSLGDTIRNVDYPLHFIDFETSALAVPYHANMRPYEQVAFQWSCHTVNAPGEEPVHAEWINTTESWPNVQFAQSLRGQLGDRGTVLMWATHERTILRQINSQLDRYGKGDVALRAWIESLTGTDDVPSTRLLDMNDLCAHTFFHPAMRGRTSIKKVLGALMQSERLLRERCAAIMNTEGEPPEDPYSALPKLEIGGDERGVHEGTGAMRAYQSMLYGENRDNVEAKQRWRQLLLQYCKLDTLAMVLIWEHWQRITSANGIR